MRFLVAVCTIAALGACRPKTTPASDAAGFGDSEMGAKFKPSNNAAWLRPTANDGAKGKRTALVLYGVDSGEGFMQAAVDYEVRSLRAICSKPNRNVNWVVFLNSYYVGNERKFMLCRDGTLSTETYDASFDQLIAAVSDPGFDPMQPKTRGLTIPLPHKREMAPLFKDYPLSHPEFLLKTLNMVAAKYFKPSDFTLTLHLKSHGSNELLLAGLTPDQLAKKVERQQSVLADHLRQESQKALGDTNFMPMADGKAVPTNINVKPMEERRRLACEANGGFWSTTICTCASTKKNMDPIFDTCERKYGTAGLGSVKLNELGMDQTGLGISTIGNRILVAAKQKHPEGGHLGEIGLGEIGMGESGMGESGMGESGMGESGMGESGMGESGMGEIGMGEIGMGESGMGESGMGESGLGFDDVGVDGMGITGLGAAVHFGTPHAAMAKVLETFAKTGSTFSFIIFESCESAVDSNATLKASLQNPANRVGGYYSATGSLWYRNYDWNYILAVAARTRGGQASAIAKILAAWSSKVTTFVHE